MGLEPRSGGAGGVPRQVVATLIVFRRLAAALRTWIFNIRASRLASMASVSISVGTPPPLRDLRGAWKA